MSKGKAAFEILRFHVDEDGRVSAEASPSAWARGIEAEDIEQFVLDAAEALDKVRWEITHLPMKWSPGWASRRFLEVMADRGWEMRRARR